MRLRCPKCQGILPEGKPVTTCPQCGAEVGEVLTPLETGLLTDFGAGLLGGVTGLLWVIALMIFMPAFRSWLFVVAIVLGSSLLTWFKAKTALARERFGWERHLIAAFCSGIGIFMMALLGSPFWLGGIAAGVGMAIGYWICNAAEHQWRREG